jgi:glycine/serine hydroxymethyltransferase
LSVLTDGTDTHSFVVNVPPDVPVDAKQICQKLSVRGILTNATPVPFEQRSLKACSGIRVGTTALAIDAVDQCQLDAIGETLGAVITRAIR